MAKGKTTKDRISGYNVGRIVIDIIMLFLGLIFIIGTLIGKGDEIAAGFVRIIGGTLILVGVFALPFFQGGLANLMISYTIQVFGAPSYASVNRVMSPIVIAIRTLSFLVVGNVYQKLGSYSYVSWIITGLLVISLICLLR